MKYLLSSVYFLVFCARKNSYNSLNGDNETNLDEQSDLFGQNFSSLASLQSGLLTHRQLDVMHGPWSHL